MLYHSRQNSLRRAKISDYTKSTNFAVKDGLTTGDPAKRIKGTEIDVEYNAIASAIASKADSNSPTFTGTPLAPTATPGTNTTQIATTAFVAAADTAAVVAERSATATLTNKTLTSPVITGANATITSGSITGITDLAVADGGTGASSITANSVILGNGTSALSGNLVAPGTSGNVLTSNGTTWSSATPSSPIGVSQTWTDVTGSRSTGTTYTNSTGKPIQLSISTVTNQFGTIRLSIAGTIVSSISGGDFGNYQAWNHIIPNGVTYAVTTTGSGSSVSSWWELR